MTNLKSKLIYLLAIVSLVFLFTGCADVSPHVATCVTSNPYGFLGGWYDFGFIIGIGALVGSGVKVTE